MTDDYDILIIGAGISGISSAYHVQNQCSDNTYAVLEGREHLGGTWDLFRYPGVRSDSDMHTLGFSFNPWARARSIADGADIRDYIEETAEQFGIARHIRFQHRLKAAAWDSAIARWTLTVETPAGSRSMTCRFLIMGSGYYSYSAPYQPSFPQQEAFKGAIVHPQHWPAELDTSGKRVIVIGSGATAVSLAPALAEQEASVTLLQRSPSYMFALPPDKFGHMLRRALPRAWADALIRRKNILQAHLLYRWCKRWPDYAARVLRGRALKAVGPAIDPAHFTPRYNPWDERLCFVPSGDLFKAIRAGKVKMVTDVISHFTPEGIALDSGETLPADIIVSATGLNMELLGGVVLSVDGTRVALRKHWYYKGCMFSGVPNLISIFGYAHASWTLKAELIARYATRLINTMDAKGADYAVPIAPDIIVGGAPDMPLSSGYVMRAAAHLPKQSITAPWHAHQDYTTDKRDLLRSKLDDGVMRFEKKT